MIASHQNLKTKDQLDFTFRKDQRCCVSFEYAKPIEGAYVKVLNEKDHRLAPERKPERPPVNASTGRGRYLSRHLSKDHLSPLALKKAAWMSTPPSSSSADSSDIDSSINIVSSSSEDEEETIVFDYPQNTSMKSDVHLSAWTGIKSDKQKVNYPPSQAFETFHGNRPQPGTCTKEKGTLKEFGPRTKIGVQEALLLDPEMLYRLVSMPTTEAFQNVAKRKSNARQVSSTPPLKQFGPREATDGVRQADLLRIYMTTSNEADSQGEHRSFGPRCNGMSIGEGLQFHQQQFLLQYDQDTENLRPSLCSKLFS